MKKMGRPTINKNEVKTHASIRLSKNQRTKLKKVAPTIQGAIDKLIEESNANNGN